MWMVCASRPELMGGDNEKLQNWHLGCGAGFSDSGCTGMQAEFSLRSQEGHFHGRVKRKFVYLKFWFKPLLSA